MKFRKVSQMPPMPMGGPPMGGPPAPPPEEKPTIIAGPLDDVNKILADAELENQLELKPDDLSVKVWQDYGGIAMGKGDSNKKGQRTDADANRDMAEVVKERELTDKMKWVRLPMGKTIDEVTSLEELGNSIQQAAFGLVRTLKNKNNPAPPGGGLMGESSVLTKRYAEKFKREDDLEIL